MSYSSSSPAIYFSAIWLQTFARSAHCRGCTIQFWCLTAVLCFHCVCILFIMLTSTSNMKDNFSSIELGSRPNIKLNDLRKLSVAICHPSSEKVQPFKHLFKISLDLKIVIFAPVPSTLTTTLDKGIY